MEIDESASARPIDRIFTRMLARYGSAWLRQWEGIPMELVKNEWERDLSGLNWGSINYAFQNLPADKPPATGAAFRKLAINKPEYFKALSAPKADPKRVAAILGGLRVMNSGHPTAWAERLKERENAGEVLTPTQRKAWRQALGKE